MARIINGKYSVVDGIERKGGFGSVFMAYDISAIPPMPVAIKILRPVQKAADPDEVARLALHREFESLDRLKHPNIVSLVEADRDRETDELFLALEWVEGNMDNYLEGGIPEPDDFIAAIGLPISGAMAFAHENGVAHRDLKPSNVLISSEGIVKVADFGISRIIDTLDPPQGQLADQKVVTVLGNFVSQPYAPSDTEAGPLARDVWGLGSTLLAGLVRRPLQSYDDLRSAKAELDVVKELEVIIERCLSENPLERPRDCREVHARLHLYWNSRSVRTLKRVPIYIGATQKVVDQMEVKDINQAERLIVEDLAESPVILSTNNEKNDDQHFILHGENWAYRVAEDNGPDDVPRLAAITAFIPRASQADRAREDGLSLEHVDFKVGIPTNRSQAKVDLDQLLNQVVEHEANVRADRRLNEARRLLGQWRSQIDARTQIERDRELPVNYHRVLSEGRRAEFFVQGDTSRVEVGQTRQVLAISGTRKNVRGEVEDVKDDRITLYLHDDAEEIPSSGKLVVDTTASKAKIQREKMAVDILAHAPAKLAQPKLGELLFNPHICQVPIPVEVLEWSRDNLDESKKEAVRAALGCEDLFLVQGPPGTGKTTFIAELVSQQLRLKPDSRILISSQTNIALDNALVQIEKIQSTARPVRIIRLADPKFGKVAPEAERFRVDGQLKRWREEAEAKSNSFIEEWVKRRGVSLGLVAESRFLREISGVLELLTSLETQLNEIESFLSGTEQSGEERLSTEELEERKTDLQDQIQELDASLKRFERSESGLMRKHLKDIEERNHRHLHELADFILGDGDAARELRDLVQLQADWLRRLSRGDGFIGALARDSAVLGATCVGLAAVRELSEHQFDLCIIDECSKATATETLVPMTRSKRWVLVGDERQLPAMVEDALRNDEILNEYSLDSGELETTLFSRLAQGLPPENQRMLKEQHRMVKAIGDLISECFYDGELISVGEVNTPTIPDVFPRPVTWHDTSRLEKRQERSSADNATSFVNVTEARHVVELVRKLVRHFEDSDEHPRVLVAAPYTAQVRELRRQVERLGELRSVSVEVATVDSVQGREADYVIFSVTRSNPEGQPGFLRLDARANVALSRAKKGLAIVGDMSFCRTTETPFRQVALYVSGHADTCARLEVEQ